MGINDSWIRWRGGWYCKAWRDKHQQQYYTIFLFSSFEVTVSQQQPKTNKNILKNIVDLKDITLLFISFTYFTKFHNMNNYLTIIYWKGRMCVCLSVCYEICSFVTKTQNLECQAAEQCRLSSRAKPSLCKLYMRKDCEGINFISP